MAHEAAMSGLLVDVDDLEYFPAEPDAVRNTLKGIWRVMEYLPIEHHCYDGQDNTTLWYV